MKIQYLRHKFSRKTAEIVEKANAIIEEYEADGMTLTLRQLYYVFIAKDLFPESWIDPVYNKRKGLSPNTKNTDKNYDRLGETLSNARLAGLVSWSAMEDRTRNLFSVPHSDSPEASVAEAATVYATDKWENQPNYVEVWIEKDALTGVIDRICAELDVPYFACKGYTSQSAQWRAGRRLRWKIAKGKKVYVLHLGDHDPSGLDMTRDNTDRLSMFAMGGTSKQGINLKRLALNMDQVRKYNPPPNPAKLTDCRTNGYVAEFGSSCWELDALEPRVMRKLIETNVKKLRDEKLWKIAVDKEKEHKTEIQALSDNYRKTIEFLRQEGDL